MGNAEFGTWNEGEWQQPILHIRHPAPNIEYQGSSSQVSTKDFRGEHDLSAIPNLVQIRILHSELRTQHSVVLLDYVL
jgi:hypothetical protein